MKLSHFFIDHPRFATVINIFIMVFGFGAASFLLPSASAEPAICFAHEIAKIAKPTVETSG